MLGLIWRAVHHETHADIQTLFPAEPDRDRGMQTRAQESRHQHQLTGHREGTHHAVLQRSVFGLIRVWNRLPAIVVNSNRAGTCQTALTEMARIKCRAGAPNWDTIFSPRKLII